MSQVEQKFLDALDKKLWTAADKLRASTMVDWPVRDSVRAKIRNMRKRLLKKYKYPPDMQADTIELILRQAENLRSVSQNSWETCCPFLFSS